MSDFVHGRTSHTAEEVVSLSDGHQGIHDNREGRRSCGTMLESLAICGVPLGRSLVLPFF
jgi:hypothetical protein